MTQFTPALSAVTLLVEDLDESREFYCRTFDLQPQWQDRQSVGFAFGSVVVNLLLMGQGERLLQPGLVGSRDSGDRGQLSIWVDDIDSVAQVLADRGVVLDTEMTDQPWGMRTLSFRDPDGHSWEIAQDLSL